MSECLEQALLLPDDMRELKGLRKREVFLSLKKYLAKVCFKKKKNPLVRYNSFMSLLSNNDNKCKHFLEYKPSMHPSWSKNGLTIKISRSRE